MFTQIKKKILTLILRVVSLHFILWSVNRLHVGEVWKIMTSHI